jgi:hypothetical protein
VDRDQAALVLEGLGLDCSDEEFKLQTAEVLGELCLMIHWLRGIVYWMVFTGAVQFTPAQMANFQTLYDSIDKHEEFVWEIAPPRGMLVQLRALRRKGYLDEEWEKLLDADDHGRVKTTKDTGEHIPELRTVLRRVLGAVDREYDPSGRGAG